MSFQRQQQEVTSPQQGSIGPRESTNQSPRRSRTYRTAVELPDETREVVVGMLNATLADTTDLMTQAKVAHWNVKGMNFYQLHLLFDEIAETLNEHIDIIAERTTALGGEATGTVRDAAATTHIPELPPDATTGREYVEALVERVGVHANSLRRDIEVAVEHDDEDTADLYTELSREVDKQLYFLEAHLQATDPEAIPRSPGAPTGSQQSTGNQQPTRGQQSQSGQTQGGSPSQYRSGSGSGQPQYRPSGGQSSQYGGAQMRSGGQSQQRGTSRGQQSYGRRSGY